jgi:hypothetical protein
MSCADHRGLGGSLGFETPVVSYAPRPISQAVEGFGEVIMDSLSRIVSESFKRRSLRTIYSGDAAGLTHDF